MAYGTNAPFGFQPRMMSTGANWNGQTNTYLIGSSYGNNIFNGDPVAPLANGTIGIGVAGTGIAGVFIGCQYQDVNGNYQFSPYWPTGTVTYSPGGPGNNIPATAFVVDDPTVLFDIQVTSSNLITHAASVCQADLNSNANFVIGTGSPVSGLSGASLDAATINTTTTLSLKIIRITPAFTNQPGNIVLDAAGGAVGPIPYSGGQNIQGLAFNNVLVQINNDVYKGGTGTLGV